MKKRLIAFGMMIVLVLCMSMTVFAAGITSEEQAVLDHFVSVQAKYASFLSADAMNNNIWQASNALDTIDFSADACNDLNTVISQLDAALSAKNPQTKKDLQGMQSELIAIVNSTNSNYFTISATLDANGYGLLLDISLKNQPSSGGSDTPSQDSASVAITTTGQGIINQTGVDTTATVAVIGGIAFISLLGVGAFVVSRSKKVAR